jgi:NitT/TauT family transport system permease protein
MSTVCAHLKTPVSSPLYKPIMMMIRQPIPRSISVLLGIASILILIGLYTFLSTRRAETKRRIAAEQHARVLKSIEQVLTQMLSAADDRAAAGRWQVELDRLQLQADELEVESREAVDRTVPTWGSLLHDGLLRTIQPQGLRKDQYWLYMDTKATLKRLVSGLAVGVALSVVLGILMGSYSWIEAFFVPPLAFLAKVPPTAMLAVFFVLVGTSFKMYVTMLAFGTLPTLAQAIYQSAKKDVPEALIFKAYTLGASHLEMMWNVIYKQILPRLIDAVRLQIGPAMVLLVAAEWMVADEGFGCRLRLFFQRTDMSVVYVYIIILGAIGLAADYLLIGLRRHLCPWFGD